MSVRIKLATWRIAGALAAGANPLFADTIKVAGIYTQPIQPKWDARLHLALQTLADTGEIDYE